jgi:hypothetical protein
MTKFTLRLPDDLKKAIEEWCIKRAEAEGVKPSLNAAVLRMLKAYFVFVEDEEDRR